MIAAGLVVGAPPQLRRVLAEPGPGEVHADAFAARRRRPCGSAGITRTSPWSLMTAHLPSPLTAKPSSSAHSSTHSRLARSNRSRDGAPRRRVRAGAALTKHPAERLMQPGEPVGHGPQPRVAGLGHRHRNDARGDAVRVDLRRGHRSVRLSRRRRPRCPGWPEVPCPSPEPASSGPGRPAAGRTATGWRPPAGRETAGCRTGTTGRTTACHRPGRNCAGTGRPGAGRRG